MENNWLKSKYNNPALTVCTYAIAFLPWTAIATMDFISSDWKTVAQTRRAGKWNLLVAGFPILLIIFYCVIQGAAEDYSEMSTAIVAACFSILHFLRTWWGLSQLHGFKRWAEKSIRELRQLGIYPAKTDDDIQEDPSKLADSLQVNNSIIDNQFTQGLAVCYLMYDDLIVLNNNKISELDEERKSTWILLIWIQCLVRLVSNRLMVPLLLASNWFMGRVGTQKRKTFKVTCKKFKFVPTEPVDMWLRWSTAFTAQLLGQWVKDFKAVDDPVEGDSDEGAYTTEEMALRRGQYFGAELAASASLHLLSTSDKNPNESSNEGSVGIRNPFLWNQWVAAEQNNHMRDGRFMKAEMFNFAVENESIFPFNTPHKHNLHRLKKNFRHMERLSYSPYNEDLERIKNELPVRWHERVLQFDYNKLEWLTILLHLADGLSQTVDISNDAQDSQAEKSVNDAQPSQSVNTVTAAQNSDSDSLADTPFGAIANLQAQLSMESDTIINEYSLNSTTKTAEYPFFNLSSIPIAHERFTLVSETNKQVTKVGELIDCWLSLVTGRQIANMIEKTKSDEWNTDCCKKSEKVNGQSLYMRTVNEELEKIRLDWRPADFDQSYNLMDHYITFMGYRMEFVRSFIALLYVKNDAENVDSFLNSSEWKNVPFTPTIHSVFKLDNLSVPYRESRGVACVIVKELQDLTESLLDKKWEDISNGGLTALDDDEKEKVKTCLTALMLLSFPSISLDVQPTINSQTTSGNGSANIPLHGKTVKVEAVCGPQKMHVQVTIIEGQNSCDLSVKGNGLRDNGLDWVLWKDAFLGRLKGFRNWQSARGLPSQPVFENVAHADTTDTRTKMIKDYTTLSNWVPFRPSFCLFELKHRDLDLEVQEIKVIKSILLDTDVNKRKKESKTASSLSIVSDLSGIEAIKTEYGGANSSTIMGNVIFFTEKLRKWLPQCNQNNADQQGQNNSMLALQRQQMKAVIEAKSEDLQQYLKLVEEKQDHKFWLSAITTIEAFVQRLLANTKCRTKETFKVIESGLEKINSFISGWGGVHEQKALYNIITMLCAIAPEPVSESLIRRVEKMIYLSALDIDVKTRSEYALMLSYIQRHKRPSEQRTMRKFYLFFPRCLLMNNLRIIYFSYRDPDDESISKLVSIPHRRTMKNFYIRERDIVNANVMEGILSNEIQRIATLMVQDNIHGKAVFRTQIQDDVIIAHDLFQYGIRKGDPNAMANLGRLYHDGGPGFEADAKKAVQLYVEAIKSEHVGAMVNLGNLYQTGGRGLEANADRAKEYYEKAISKNHAGAKVNLANMYFNGIHQGGNAKEAKEMYTEVMKRTGHVGAIVNLAYSLQIGKPTPKDPVEAAELYQQAIDKARNVSAMLNLGTLMKDGAEPNVKKAEMLYKQAIAEASDVDAMYSLGQLLMQRNSSETDNENAAKLFHQAIDEGSDIESMLQLASIYEKGPLGVKQDKVRAMTLYKDVIEKDPNDVKALLGLANLLSKRKNLACKNQAFKLYEVAIEELNSREDDSFREELQLAKIMAKSTLRISEAQDKLNHLIEYAGREIRGEAMVVLGQLLERNEPGRAEELYEKAATDPYNIVNGMVCWGMLLANKWWNETDEVKKEEHKTAARKAFYDAHNEGHGPSTKAIMDLDGDRFPTVQNLEEPEDDEVEDVSEDI